MPTEDADLVQQLRDTADGQAWVTPDLLIDAANVIDRQAEQIANLHTALNLAKGLRCPHCGRAITEGA